MSFGTEPFTRGVSCVIHVVSVITCFILKEYGFLFYFLSSDVPKVIHAWKVSDHVLQLLQNFVYLYLIINYFFLNFAPCDYCVDN